MKIFQRHEAYSMVTACVSRIQRDIVDRGRDVVGVIQQYTRFVKPAFDTYVAPSRKHADVIVPWARRAAACSRHHQAHCPCRKCRCQRTILRRFCCAGRSPIRWPSASSQSTSR